MRPLDDGLYLDQDCPINWQWPGNSGLVSEWAGVPLSGWWGGKTVYDLAHGAKPRNDGTFNGGVSWQPSGRPGGHGCLRFNGSASYVSFPTIRFPAGFTLACWINTSDTGTTGADYVPKVPLFNDPSSYLDFGIGSTGSGRLSCYSGPASVQGSGSIADGTWHHVAATHSLSGTLTLYADGKINGSGSVTYDTVHLTVVRMGGNFGPSGSFLNGLMDVADVYNRAISSAEVAALCDQGQRGQPDRWSWRKPVTYFTPQKAGGNSIFWGGVFASRIIGRPAA
jgi:hypothetical protein